MNGLQQTQCRKVKATEQKMQKCPAQAPPNGGLLDRSGAALSLCEVPLILVSPFSSSSTVAQPSEMPPSPLVWE